MDVLYMNMKMLLLLLLSALLLMPAALAEDEIAAPSRCGALRVADGRLTDSNGNPVQLRGISTHGLSWYPGYVNDGCFRQLREEWGANVIRLAMYTAESGGYCTDGNRDDLKAIIARGVQYATDVDMYVIIDWHILSDGNPLTHMEEAKAFFDEMSRSYAGHVNVLYEICNEPNGGTPWSDVKRYAGEIIPVIRANDPDAVILVGTPNWCQYIGDAAADPIEGFDNIMYTVHFYAATHKSELRDEMTRAALGGLPVFVSEFGICDASGNGNIDEEEANRWIETMDNLGISYVNWNLSNNDESSALLMSGCTRTSGFTSEDLSTSGRWVYAMLSGKAPAETAEATDASPAAPAGVEFAQADGIVCAIEKTNEWESNGTYRQYAVTVRNTSGADCAQWSVKIEFDGEIRVSDGWNGEYSVDGSTLYISSVSYNGTIPAGGSIGDVGCILIGNAQPVQTAG